MERSLYTVFAKSYSFSAIIAIQNPFTRSGCADDTASGVGGNPERLFIPAYPLYPSSILTADHLWPLVKKFKTDKWDKQG